MSENNDEIVRLAKEIASIKAKIERRYCAIDRATADIDRLRKRLIYRKADLTALAGRSNAKR